MCLSYDLDILEMKCQISNKSFKSKAIKYYTSLFDFHQQLLIKEGLTGDALANVKALLKPYVSPRDLPKVLRNLKKNEINFASYNIPSDVGKKVMEANKSDLSMSIRINKSKVPVYLIGTDRCEVVNDDEMCITLTKFQASLLNYIFNRIPGYKTNKEIAIANYLDKLKKIHPYSVGLKFNNEPISKIVKYSKARIVHLLDKVSTQELNGLHSSIEDLRNTLYLTENDISTTAERLKEKYSLGDKAEGSSPEQIILAVVRAFETKFSFSDFNEWAGTDLTDYEIILEVEELTNLGLLGLTFKLDKTELSDKTSSLNIQELRDNDTINFILNVFSYLVDIERKWRNA